MHSAIVQQSGVGGVTPTQAHTHTHARARASAAEELRDLMKKLTPDDTCVRAWVGAWVGACVGVLRGGEGLRECT